MISAPGVYMIRNTRSGLSYVGSSLDTARRWHQHRDPLIRGNHPNKTLQRDWLEHGEQAFVVSLLEPVAPVEARLAAAEQRWSDWFKSASVPLYSERSGRAVNTKAARLPGLRRQRLLAALTQEELATRAGVRRLTITRLENGGEALPPTVRRLAEALGCTPRDLIETNQ